MKKKSKLKKQRVANNPRAVLLRRCLAGASLLALSGHAHAAETNTAMTAQQQFEGGTNAYQNWIEVGAGGMMFKGSAAQGQQNQQLKRGAFGGITDFHYQANVATNTTLAVDGRGLFDEHDYKFGLDLKREDVGYVRFNVENFRTWYNGVGGFDPPTGTQYVLGGDNVLGIDRGEVSFEAGLLKKNLPKVTFKYSHRYRDGEKSSTAWGPVTPSVDRIRGLAPSFYDIDEKSDSFQLDVATRIKKTDVGGGIRFETGEIDNALKSTPEQQQLVTDRQGTTYDMFSVNAFTETWLKPNLFFSSGFLFANLDNDFTGSRRYGEDFDVGATAPNVNVLGYTDLNGGSHKQEYVLNLNLMSIPLKDVTIVPSIRAQKEDWDADSSGIGTRGEATGPFFANSERESLDVRERLDIRYSGVTNWVFYGGGEWTEGEGNLKEHGGLSRINDIGIAPIDRETDDNRFFQKYFAGIRWYPIRQITADIGGYYKRERFDYDHEVDSTPNAFGGNRFPAFLVMQGFDTYDENARLTFKPFRRVTLVSRFEYQRSTVNTSPDPASGFAGLDTSKLTSYIFGQNIGWVPIPRLSLQAGFNFVWSKTKTPTSEFTQAVLDSKNNYWTANFNAGIVLSEKTDLNLGYFYYHASDYDANTVGTPLGAGGQEHGVTATLTHRLTQNMRLNLKYGFWKWKSYESGGNDNVEAHLVYSSIQYRF